MPGSQSFNPANDLGGCLEGMNRVLMNLRDRTFTEERRPLISRVDNACLGCGGLFPQIQPQPSPCA